MFQMTKRFLLVLIVTLSACGFGVYRLFIYDEARPNSSWPLLEPASVDSSMATTSVGPNVRCSESLGEDSFEFCDIAADPTDATKLFSTALRWRGSELDLLGFYSHDGGTSWQKGCELLADSGERLSDSSIAYGPDGSLVLAHMRSEPGEHRQLGTEGAGKVEFHSSSDGGKSWSEFAVLNNYIDRPWIAIDTTDGVNRGNLYCAGNVDELIIYSSEDANTLSDPITPLKKKLVNCRHSNPVVTPEGTVVVICEDRHLGSKKGRYRPRMLTYVSTDGGKNFAEKKPVNTKWWHPSILSSRGGKTMWPRLAADPGSSRFGGRVYCVWGDGNNRDSERIFFSSSPDDGGTWTKPVVISEQPMEAGTEHEYMSFKPSVAVNKDGVVAVSWYDRRGMPKSRRLPSKHHPDAFVTEANGWHLRLRASVDGGMTWLPSVQVSEAPGEGPVEVGHAAGIAADAGGRFHPVWIDNRTGRNQLWTATVEVTREP